ncbi:MULTISPECIES: YnaM/YnfT family protein [Klebsiella]|nr:MULTISPECIES: YnaM/YnfT family protein [Klebsiella]
MFISTTLFALFALFASMLIGLGMVWKSISNNPDN